jgi:hypothetical protein
VLFLVQGTRGEIELTWVHFGFAILALSPWYLVNVRSLKFGDTEVQFEDFESSTVEYVEKPVRQVIDSSASLLSADDLKDLMAEPRARKILATLWRYQKLYFANDNSKRWTFAASPLAPQYAAYLFGLAPLVQSGVAVVSAESGHCMLSARGLLYCQDHDGDLQTEKDLYEF